MADDSRHVLSEHLIGEILRYEIASKFHLGKERRIFDEKGVLSEDREIQGSV
jgi:hypothetical protein